MSMIEQIRPLAMFVTGKGAARPRAETYGLIAFGLAATFAAALSLLPIGAVPSPEPPRPFAPKAGAMSAFIEAAPFDALRRPQTSVGMLDAPVVAAPADPFVISGILIDGNDRKVMFSGAPGVWRAEGEEADGWLVRHIEPEQVILTRGADIKTPTYRAALETLGNGSTPSPPPAEPVTRPFTPARLAVPQPKG